MSDSIVKITITSDFFSVVNKGLLTTMYYMFSIQRRHSVQEIDQGEGNEEQGGYVQEGTDGRYVMKYNC